MPGNVQGGIGGESPVVESQEEREEREREWRETHRKKLEEEMAGDYEREWEEIAKQRKLRAEVSVS